MLLRIRSITYLATRINGYELVDPGGQDLARFTACERMKGGGAMKLTGAAPINSVEVPVPRAVVIQLSV